MEVFIGSSNDSMARATEREEREREREFTYSDAIRTAIRWAPIVRDNVWLKLAACILVDFIGFCSYLLPGVGEAGDAIWAPAQAFFLQYMFSSVVITAIGFCEEIGPGTDIVPTASLAWGIENLPVRGHGTRVDLSLASSSFYSTVGHSHRRPTPSPSGICQSPTKVGHARADGSSHEDIMISCAGDGAIRD